MGYQFADPEHDQRLPTRWFDGRYIKTLGHLGPPSGFQLANWDHKTPAAMAEPSTPATLGAMACMSR